MGYNRRPKPENIAKRILENKDRYQTQITELKHLVNTNDIDEFTRSMYSALVTGRKITPKMEKAINSIVKRNSPLEKEKTRLNKERILLRLERLLSEVDSLGDRSTSRFILSIMESTHRWGKLTKKQMEAINKVHKRVKERKVK